MQSDHKIHAALTKYAQIIQYEHFKQNEDDTLDILMILAKIGDILNIQGYDYYAYQVKRKNKSIEIMHEPVYRVKNIISDEHSNTMFYIKLDSSCSNREFSLSSFNEKDEEIIIFTIFKLVKGTLSNYIIEFHKDAIDTQRHLKFYVEISIGHQIELKFNYMNWSYSD